MTSTSPSDRSLAPGPLLAVALCAVHALSAGTAPILPALAVAVVAGTWRRSGRLTRAAAACLAVLELVLSVAALSGARNRDERAREEAARSAVEIEARWHQLAEALMLTADAVARLPELRPALRGDRSAMGRLFSELEGIHAKAKTASPEPVAVGVHRGPLDPVAWAGRVNDMRFVGEIEPVERTVVVLVGRVTTTAVALAPVTDERGAVLGVVSAEVPVAVRRHIRNDYLDDFDVLADGFPSDSVAVRYRDVLEPAPEHSGDATAPAPGVVGAGRLLSPDGKTVASYALQAAAAHAPTTPWPLGRAVLGSLLGIVVLVASLGGRRLVRDPVRLAWAGAMGRGILLAYGGYALEAGPRSWVSPEVYASPLLGPLTRSPLDLLWTAIAATLLAWAAVVATERRWRGGPPRPYIAGLSAVASLPLLAGAFFVVADTVANTSVDLERLSLVPTSSSHLILQAGLLLILVATLVLLGAVHLPAGPWPSLPTGRLARGGVCAAIGLVAYAAWPRGPLGLPLAPAVALFAIAVAAAGRARALRGMLHRVGDGGRAIAIVAVLVLVSTLLYPTLVHYGEKSLRSQIEHDYAPLVLQQPDWQEFLLAETLRRVDAMRLLEELPEEPFPPGIEELAFAVWSETDLAAFGLSSAIEIQDEEGRTLSRFALGLPSFGQRPTPSRSGWEIGWDLRGLASAQRRVRYAARSLEYGGRKHGAIQVYLGDDLWNLPFVEGRDPYPTLFRTSPPGGAAPRTVTLTAYDRSQTAVFSSADRPPVLSEPVLRRVQQRPTGVWVTLPVDDGLHHVYLFAERTRIYGLSFERVGVARYAADLVECAASVGLLGVALLLGVLTARSVLGYSSLSLGSVVRAIARRFWLRLFVAFVSLAVAPVGILEAVVRGVLARQLREDGERQALGLAAVAQRAVEDAAYFQRRDVPTGEPVGDAALVWVAGLIRNDLDVFQDGVLLASSKRELYASGLLPPRVSSVAHRTLVLDGHPSAVHTERIGSFSYRVVSVPVRLGSREPAVLSIPLALRQREVESVLAGLDRTIRLASLVFLGLAAALAHLIARRISGPIRDLTLATRRVAEGDLEARVEARSRDELKDLVESFNRMAQDLRRQRQDLERSNRLAAWADMARQVAHEVKNPLTPIQLSAEHLRRVFREGAADFPATLESCTDTILKQVRTLRGIVTEFSAFARPPAAERTRARLEDVVQRAVQPYQATLPAGVTLAIAAAPDLPDVPVDARLVERAVVNLVENAVQAVHGSGAIWVRIEAAPGRVILHVEDDGPGVPDDVLLRVFEPFFSTKTSGSGLGLALVKKIAEDHGGGASLESRPGEGTRVTVWLPTTESGTD